MNFKNMGSEPVPATPLPLARQLSVYSLTFDEFQSTLGGPQKDFGSMNMDEFLRNIWTAEESQAMASALGCGGGGGGAGQSSGAAAAAAMGGPSVASNNLQRQGSLTLPRTLSQKTVDEVWRELLRESNTDGSELQQHQRQQTLGEMTLEEFLVRAGVVREEPIQRPIISNNNHHITANNGNSSSIFFGELPNSNNSNPGLSLGFAQNPNRNQANLAKRPYPAPLQVGGNVVGIGDNGMNNGLIPGGVVGLGGGGGGVTVAGVASPDGLGKGNGDLSSLSPVPYMFGSGMRGRKCSGAVEKVVERRQRRMIKNRESAARSRARKQAYTMELEAEVAKLKEQNQELEKKQAEIMEMQKNQVMELINQQRGPKKLCLRRTQTGPW